MIGGFTMENPMLARCPTAEEAALDATVIADLTRLRRAAPLVKMIPLKLPPPNVADMSIHLRYIRYQGGAGCWGYSMLAVWDIMNEMACPYSPNLSMRIWMMLHRRRELWEKQGGLFTPDGRFHKMTNPEWGFFQSFGNTTEGTEPTLDDYPSLWPDGGWSAEGIDEAANYRLASLPKPIEISSISFIHQLASGHPIRLCLAYSAGQGHFVAVLGYDQTTQIFRYVNSAGDKWGTGGFGTYTFAEIDAKKAGNTSFTGAEIVEIHPPRPIPVARIRFTHSNRSNVHLNLSVEGSPRQPNKFWPHGWDDKSANLSLTVRLPNEFIWPPSPGNRLVLDLYDSGQYTKTGGSLDEFTATFGGHSVPCSSLAAGPIGFKPHEHRRFLIP
jgi:hypothetical protein